MIVPRESVNPVEMLPGLTRRVLVNSEKLMLTEFTFEQGVEVPLHAHPHEQMGYLVAGRMRMTMGEEVIDCSPGDSWHAPPDLPHAGAALEPSVVIEMFHPPRQDYLPVPPTGQA